MFAGSLANLESALSTLLVQYFLPSGVVTSSTAGSLTLSIRALNRPSSTAFTLDRKSVV